jgi:hypothetical protein
MYIGQAQYLFSQAKCVFGYFAPFQKVQNQVWRYVFAVEKKAFVLFVKTKGGQVFHDRAFVYCSLFEKHGQFLSSRSLVCKTYQSC